jgi:hypothetical protein
VMPDPDDILLAEVAWQEYRTLFQGERVTLDTGDSLASRSPAASVVPIHKTCDGGVSWEDTSPTCWP